MKLFLDADCLDLLLSVALGLEGSGTNLDPRVFGGSCFNDLVLLCRLLLKGVVFFFRAEDGIRDIGVTGVQTCALPIWCYGASNSPPTTRTGCSAWSAWA